ncbi:MAG: YcgN family cysteine cluster protein [Spirochaetales bacterium]|nr:YcgN family cysteine cluster protein [Spirochaetales bacterium]
MCCLHKIEDEETGKIVFSYVACKYLDIPACICTHYTKRKEVNPDCIRLTPDTVSHYRWLPDTCSYRLIAEGKSLPSWHPLLTNNPGSIHQAKRSIAHIALSENDVDAIENHLIIEF